MEKVTLENIGNRIINIEGKLNNASTERDRTIIGILLSQVELEIRAIELDRVKNSKVSESTAKEILLEMVDWTSEDIMFPDEDLEKEGTPELLQHRLEKVKDLFQRAENRSS